MCFLCVALRARSNIISCFCDQRAPEESFADLYFQLGNCRIYSISEFELDGGDIM